MRRHQDVSSGSRRGEDYPLPLLHVVPQVAGTTTSSHSAAADGLLVSKKRQATVVLTSMNAWRLALHKKTTKQFRIAAICFLFVTAAVGWWTKRVLLPKLIPHKDSKFEDTFWRGIWTKPLAYAKIHYLDNNNNEVVLDYKYRLHDNNTFVVNLDNDVDRWEHFLGRNRVGRRFSATDLRQQGSLNDPAFSNLMNTYPNLRHIVDTGRLGEAGVFASHLRLYQEILDRGDEYAFVFEDDAVLRTSLVESRTVIAPYPVDMVFLTPNVLEATRLNDGSMIRVMGGAGAYGLIVTRRGLQKLLRHLQKGTCFGFVRLPFSSCQRDPLDIAFMKLSAMHGFEIYLPTKGWPLVSHTGRFNSTKQERDNNEGN